MSEAPRALILVAAGRPDKRSSNMVRKPCHLVFSVAVLLVFALCFDLPAARGKRVLFVDSYHQGYPWSDGVELGVRQILEPTGVELEIVRMDTKREPSEEHMIQAGLRAMEVIKEFKPDVVIAADDNAQQYLVVPHLLDTELPVVFCGVNWDASIYGYPTRTVTGMLEHEGVEEMVALFKLHAKGTEIGYLSGDTLVDHKIVQEFNKRFFNGAMRFYAARSFEEFKRLFLQAQQEVHMLFLRNYAGIDDWNSEEAKTFLLENIALPTGSHLDFMAEYVIYTIGKVPEEQGQWAATTALRILDGESPADIPMARNEQVRLVVNLKMADAAGIVLPLTILKTARVIGKD